MRAIISVHDKTDVVDFGRGLSQLGWEIFSTGGTQRVLRAGGVPARAIEDLTGSPEMLGGRVKTLHPAIFAALLARPGDPDHRAELTRLGFEPIDLVAVNLYPFADAISAPNVTLEAALDEIDIGGVSLIRAAAKNFPDVLVLVDPADYPTLLQQLGTGAIDQQTRQRLARKAFQHVASYDTAISQFLREGDAGFPERLTLSMAKMADLRYGENPHQAAALYREEVCFPRPTAITAAVQLGGKELSHNNLLDLDAALRLVQEFAQPTAAIIKHGNPCGLASDESLTKAFGRALAGDPVSAFGGIVGLNRTVDRETAQQIKQTFFEGIVAPHYDPDALSILRAKRDLRIMEAGPGLAEEPPRQAKRPPAWEVRQVSGGYLVQTEDVEPEDATNLRPVTDRHPTLDELTDLLYAWRAVKHVRSNAIVLAKGLMLVGVGAGQPSRVGSVEIAVKQAADRAVGSVLASDAFFPFPDGIEAAAHAGVTAIVQPGGSVRDEEVIRAANRHHLAMVFTGRRQFKH